MFFFPPRVESDAQERQRCGQHQRNAPPASIPPLHVPDLLGSEVLGGCLTSPRAPRRAWPPSRRPDRLQSPTFDDLDRDPWSSRNLPDELVEPPAPNGARKVPTGPPFQHERAPRSLAASPGSHRPARVRRRWRPHEASSVCKTESPRGGAPADPAAPCDRTPGPGASRPGSVWRSPPTATGRRPSRIPNSNTTMAVHAWRAALAVVFATREPLGSPRRCRGFRSGPTTRKQFGTSPEFPPPSIA